MICCPSASGAFRPITETRPALPTCAQVDTTGYNKESRLTRWRPTDAGQKCPLSDHFADNRRHVRCRESWQRFGADVAERAKEIGRASVREGGWMSVRGTQ